MFSSGTDFTICVLYNQNSGWRVDKCSIVKEKGVEVVPNKKVAVASMKVAANGTGDDCQIGSADADDEEDYEDETVRMRVTQNLVSYII